MNELDDPNYHDVDDQVGLNYRGAADDRGRNCELDVLDDLNYRGAADDRGRNCELDVLVDLNYRGAADDPGQSCEPDDRDDRDALGVRDDLQHQLGVADDFPLQMDALVDLCARHYFCEVRDQMKILVYRRVAWHIDAIAKNTNKD
jgi:hypothetical protein